MWHVQSVEDKDSQGYTPLVCSILSHNDAVTDLLLKKGALARPALQVRGRGGRQLLRLLRGHGCRYEEGGVGGWGVVVVVWCRWMTQDVLCWWVGGWQAGTWGWVLATVQRQERKASTGAAAEKKKA